MAVVVGQEYKYVHPDGAGYGEAARGETLTAEMTELDLQQGQVVVISAIDADSDWPVVNWTDAQGIDRRTTIDPANFDAYFELQP